MLWNTIKQTDEWNLHDKKIFMVELYNKDYSDERILFSLHKQVYIIKSSTFEDYFNQINKTYENFWEYYYDKAYKFKFIRVTLWTNENLINKNLNVKTINNFNQKRSYSTLNKEINKEINNFIEPIKISRKLNTLICTIDIEIISIDNKQ